MPLVLLCIVTGKAAPFFVLFFFSFESLLDLALLISFSSFHLLFFPHSSLLTSKILTKRTPGFTPLRTCYCFNFMVFSGLGTIFFLRLTLPTDRRAWDACFSLLFFFSFPVHKPTISISRSHGGAYLLFSRDKGSFVVALRGPIYHRSNLTPFL